ncbi:MAG: EAL domain-containing protein [Marinobacter sp.]|nr:EAL domain-containing protein [Marinobacter sp.]
MFWWRNRKEQAQLKRLIEAQYSIIEAITSVAPLENKLNEICSLIEQQISGALCTVMLLDDDKTTLSVGAAPGFSDELKTALQKLPIEDGSSACGTAAYQRQPVIFADMTQDGRFGLYADLLDRNKLVACWSFPIMGAEEELLGTFAIYFRRRRTPNQQHFQLIERSRQMVSLVLEYHRQRLLGERNEQHFRSLFTHNPDAVFTQDLEGRFIQINQAGSDLIDYSEAEILGQRYEALIPPEDIERTLEHFEGARSGIPQRYEIKVIRRSGDVLDIDITNMPIVIDGKVTGIHGVAKDRTEQRRTEARLRLLERGVEASANGVTIADARQQGFPLIYVNPAFEHITGYPRDEILGRSCNILQGPATEESAVRHIRQNLSEFREVHTSLLNYRKDGTTFWNDLYIAPVRDNRQEVTHFIGVQNDISDRVQHEETLAFQASHDALTGLPNRVYLEAHLADICRQTFDKGQYLYVMFIDLDGFKPVNDSLGHHFGDQILKQTAGRLTNATPTGAVLVRFGGDEFVALVPAPDDGVDVDQVAERILAQFVQPFHHESVEVTLSAAIGIAASKEPLAKAMLLIQRADMAMYQAKKLGGNTWQWFNDSLNKHAQHEVSLRQQLQEALTHRQFQLFYQPIFDNDLNITGVEALIRWKHPTRGYISPAEFIPLAERTGQIIPISEWVMEEAATMVARLAEIGVPTISINLSPLQFHRHRLVEQLTHLLDRHQVQAGQLCVEITENVFLDDPHETIKHLRALQNLGVLVAIDDFGTGFSSLSYMRDMPVDKIKIDQTFTNGITSSQRDAAITRGTLSMAHELGMDVVAEGVETEEQFNMLKSFGCTSYQGFWYSRPLPWEDLQDFTRSRNSGARLKL